MLKKNDLAKQFELVVKQEIKNYQDSLSFVLESIRELKESFTKIKDEVKQNYDYLKNDLREFKREVQTLKEGFQAGFQSFQSHINDQRFINDRNQTQILDLHSDVVKKINIDEKFQSKIDEIWNEVHEIKTQQSINIQSVHDSLDDLLLRFRREILKTKQDILDSPTEAKLVKNELDEKLASHKVDVAGIMRELNIYKHDNMVTEKKIEQIHMQLDRLKKNQEKR